MKERLDYIDKAKGILIMLMVIGHIWQSGYVHNVIYTFHMPAFFVISGMLLCYTTSYKKNFIEFVKNRVYSYGIPFVFIEILGCLTDIVRHGVTLNVKGYLYNTLTFNFNDPNLWFLIDLFLIEIIFVLFIKITNSDTMKMYLLCAICFFTSILLPTGNNYITTIASSFRNILFFAIGFFSITAFMKKNIKVLILACVLVFVIPMLYGKRTNNGLTIENLMFILSGLAGTYVTLTAGYTDVGEKINKILSFAGKNTIIVYGTHRLYYSILGVLVGIDDYSKTPILVGIVIFIVVIFMEIPTIYIINNFFPFLSGKRKKKK